MFRRRRWPVRQHRSAPRSFAHEFVGAASRRKPQPVHGITELLQMVAVRRRFVNSAGLSSLLTAALHQVKGRILAGDAMAGARLHTEQPAAQGFLKL